MLTGDSQTSIIKKKISTDYWNWSWFSIGCARYRLSCKTELKAQAKVLRCGGVGA